MCDNCEYDSKGIYADELDVCKECRGTKVALITQSDAVNRYPIAKNDLESVRRIQYKGTYVTYLFLVKDVEHLCIEKFGSDEAYKKVMADKDVKKKERKDRVVKNESARRKELDEYLKSVGLTGVRGDSTLCDNYIEKGDKGGFSKEEIAKIMKEMEFYYNCTEYKSILYNRRNEEFRYMKECGMYHKWTDEDEDDIRDEAKDSALQGYVMKNFNDVHKCILEVPPSLKGEFDEYYEKIRRDREKKKQKEMELVKIQMDKFKKSMSDHRESKRKFRDTTDQHRSLLDDVNRICNKLN